MTSEQPERPGRDVPAPDDAAGRGDMGSPDDMAHAEDVTAAADHADPDDGAQEDGAPEDGAPEDRDDDQGPGLRAALEAIMLVADEPVAEVLLAQVLERPRGEVAATLRELSAEYTADGRGFDLREAAGGWRLYTREDCAALVERFVRDGQEVRLTQAALETLAVVAYRQPVSRARVSAVRGVNCDGVMRTLTLRGLVERQELTRRPARSCTGRPATSLSGWACQASRTCPRLAPFLPDDFEDIEDNEYTRI